jgi:hypothetical protein
MKKQERCSAEERNAPRRIYTKTYKSSTACEHCPFAAAIRDATPALNKTAGEMTRAQVVRTARKLARNERFTRRRNWSPR